MTPNECRLTGNRVKSRQVSRRRWQALGCLVAAWPGMVIGQTTNERYSSPAVVFGPSAQSALQQFRLTWAGSRRTV